MNPLALFTGPYATLAKWGVIALLLAVFGAFCWFKGDAYGSQKLFDHQQAELREATRIAGVRTKIVTQIETKYRDRIRTVTVAGETIVKEVKVYVTQADDAACNIPAGFVRQFNAGWSGEPAGPAAESDRRPSGVPLSAVAETDAWNATSCRVYKEQRDGLIEFYRKQQGVR